MKKLLLYFLISYSAYAENRVALIKYIPVFNQVDKNIKTLLKISEKAISNGANILLLAEGAVDGYQEVKSGRITKIWCRKDLPVWDIHISCESIENVAEEAYGEGKVFSKLKEFVARHSIYMGFTLPEKDTSHPRTRFYNSAYIIGPHQLIAKHRKSKQWFNEYAYAVGGTEPTIAKLPFKNFGILICADALYRYSFYEYYQQQAVQILFAPGYGIDHIFLEQMENQYQMKGFFVDPFKVGHHGKIAMEGDSQGYALYNLAGDLLRVEKTSF